MTDEIKHLTLRIEDLESKVTFQDETIEQLNQSLINQQKKFNQLTQLVERLTQQLQDSNQPSIIETNQEEPPPHY